MRCKGVIIAFGLALLTSGCYTADGVYLREGVGTAVPANDIVAVTNIQEIYFGEICRQAGLNVRQTQDGALLCDETSMSPAAWTIFVQAGMNDIDRRCDAYLAWLDNRRRWNEPILKQLHSTAAVTAAVMGLTGVGATPIAIVGAAFGFAQETFVNLSGRLITEINQSTVQSLVLTRQNSYRDGLSSRVIPNRPTALYALRSYLRLCMPMTIETEINVTMTGVDRNGFAPAPMITPATVATPLRARAALEPTGPSRRGPPAGAVGPIEVVTIDEDVRKLQALICLPQDGTLGPSTRVGIRVMQQALRDPNPNAELGKRALRVVLERIASMGACNTAQHRNYFERTILSTSNEVLQLQKELNAWQVGNPVPETGVMDMATRQKIAAVRQAMTGLAEGPDLSEQVTPSFRLAVRRPPAR